MAETTQGADVKNRVKYIGLVVVGVILLYLAYSMFGGSSEEQVETKKQMKPNPDIPKISSLLSGPSSKQQQPVTENEKREQAISDYVQQRYLADMAMLQILTLEKAIEETNKDIAKAKLDTVTAQKKVLDMFPQQAVPTAANYAKTLEQPATGSQAVAPATQAKIETPKQPEIVPTTQYTVVSVSRIRGEWNAVLGYQGTLYNVKPGDIISADGSVVLSIDKSGVLLEKNKTKIKVPMAQII